MGELAWALISTAIPIIKMNMPANSMLTGMA
jgi:hypothetical protein